MPKNLSFLFLYVCLTMLLGGCFVSPPPSSANAPQVTSLEILSDDSSIQATGISTTGRRRALRLMFDQPMNRASVERAVSLNIGSYSPSSNPVSFSKLLLNAICNGKWRVRNPNSFPMSFNWDVYNTSEKGVGTVAANSDAFFYTTLDSETVRLFAGSQRQQTKVSNSTTCTTQPWTFSWSSDARTVTLNLSKPLVNDSTYTLIVSTNAMSDQNVRIPEPSVQIFNVTSGVVVTGQQQRFVKTLYALSPERLEEVFQVVENYLEQNPNATQSELDSFVMQEVLRYAASNLESGEIEALSTGCAINAKLNSVECRKVWTAGPAELLALEIARQRANSEADDRTDIFPLHGIDDPNSSDPAEQHDRLTSGFGLNDAFKHTFWNAMITALLSARKAEEWTNAHECIKGASIDEGCREGVLGVPPADYLDEWNAWGNMESQMDLNNNAVGRNLRQTVCAGSTPASDLDDCVADYMLNNGNSGILVMQEMPATPGYYCATIWTTRAGLMDACLVPIEEHPDFPKTVSYCPPTDVPALLAQGAKLSAFNSSCIEFESGQLMIQVNGASINRSNTGTPELDNVEDEWECFQEKRTVYKPQVSVRVIYLPPQDFIGLPTLNVNGVSFDGESLSDNGQFWIFSGTTTELEEGSYTLQANVGSLPIINGSNSGSFSIGADPTPPAEPTDCYASIQIGWVKLQSQHGISDTYYRGGEYYVYDDGVAELINNCSEPYISKNYVYYVGGLNSWEEANAIATIEREKVRDDLGVPNYHSIVADFEQRVYGQTGRAINPRYERLISWDKPSGIYVDVPKEDSERVKLYWCTPWSELAQLP